MADSKLLKTLAKIAGQLTHLKDVITISEPCAPARYPRPQAAAAPPTMPAALLLAAALGEAAIRTCSGRPTPPSS